MGQTFHTKEFAGPLELLLELLAEKKMDITEIALSDVTEQFLAYIDGFTEDQVHELADFLVVASKLLWLKARALLPQFGDEDDSDSGVSLEDQLRLYKVFVVASKQIHKQWTVTDRMVFRIEPPRKVEHFVWPTNINSAVLHETMGRLITRLAPPKPLPHTTIDRTISLKEKIFQIRQLLVSGRPIMFAELVKQAQNKTELIVSFLAILELAKQRVVAVHQPQPFHDIDITQV